LPIARRAEQSFRDILQLAVAISPRGRKIVHHQKRIFGLEGQPLEGCGCRREVAGQAIGVQGRSEVLLAECRHGGLEHPSFSGEKETEIHLPQRGSVSRGQQEEADPVGR
jgi:hypothetical protein